MIFFFFFEIKKRVRVDEESACTGFERIRKV